MKEAKVNKETSQVLAPIPDTSSRTGVLCCKRTRDFWLFCLEGMENPDHRFPHNLPLSRLPKFVLCSINLTWADISNLALLDHI